MAFLEARTKFSHGPSRQRPISADLAGSWNRTSMYRTSYNDMYTKTPVASKNYVLPSYGGYVPGMKANNDLGRSISKISRNCFDKQDRFKTVTSKFDVAQPTEYSAKFGTQTMMRPQSCQNEANWTTTSRLSLRNPNERSKMNTRTKQQASGGALFDKKMLSNYRPQAQKRSGFVQNSSLFDGAGWKPTSNMHSDMFRTSYRMGFSEKPSFHKTMTRFNAGKMPIKAVAYDVDDWRGKAQTIQPWKP